MNDIIFVYSPHHTGTWFIIEFLRRHPEITHFLELKEIIDLKTVFDYKKLVVHSHSFSRLPNVYKTSVNYYADVLNDVFLRACPTITPIRDPLLALLTLKKRHPDLNGCFIINEYLRVFDQSGYNKIKFIPIDLLEEEDVDIRHKRLVDICTYVGLINCQYVIAAAEDWKKENKAADPHEYDKMYQEGDYKKINKLFKTEIGLLKYHEKELRSFLEPMGYKDLLWTES